MRQLERIILPVEATKGLDEFVKPVMNEVQRIILPSEKLQPLQRNITFDVKEEEVHQLVRQIIY